MAAALKGFGKSRDGSGFKGVVGVCSSPVGHFSAGVMIGELKQRRYSAMKNSSFKAQVMKSTI